MRRLVWALAAISLLAAGCGAAADAQPDGPRTVVFGGEDLCTEVIDGGRCDFVMCDLIPEGQTFEETCGPYFQEGLAPTGALSNDDLERILNRVTECSFAGEIIDNRMQISPADTDGLTISGPTPWLEDWQQRFSDACNI